MKHYILIIIIYNIITVITREGVPELRGPTLGCLQAIDKKLA